jgi:uncharacterized membrane protein YccC
MRAADLSRIAELVRIPTEIVRGLSGLFRAGPQRVDQLEVILSVLLAIALARLLPGGNTGWAAFSGYMVARAQWRLCLRRASLRMLGTLFGALLGYLTVRFGAAQPLPLAAAMFAVTLVCLYMSVLGRRAYAWLFVGITFAMVTIDSLGAGAASVDHFVFVRVMEVFFGISASAAVSALSTLTLRRRVPARPLQLRTPVPCSWNPLVGRHALQAALATGWIPLAAHWMGTDAAAQAAITVMAVMTVAPAKLQTPSGAIPRRVVHRFVGCALGATSALVTLATVGHNLPLTLAAVALGVAVGRHIENESGELAYVGTQFSLAFLVVLVPGASAEAGLARFTGILIGIAVLTGLRLIARALHWREV